MGCSSPRRNLVVQIGAENQALARPAALGAQRSTAVKGASSTSIAAALGTGVTSQYSPSSSRRNAGGE